MEAFGPGAVRQLVGITSAKQTLLLAHYAFAFGPDRTFAAHLGSGPIDVSVAI